MDGSRSSPATCSGTSWPAAPGLPLGPQESSLNAELTYGVFLEMAIERARSPANTPAEWQDPDVEFPLDTTADAYRRRSRLTGRGESPRKDEAAPTSSSLVIPLFSPWYGGGRLALVQPVSSVT